ncbi:hypothetical protein L4X63_09150 [Geomonas sp. Red32]|uniref:hypothetical protein n=1 Tax=Geomonas sp. Red32 TaxID=2912856 RepID=UPI00202CB099|nr:hypothetical protein [Geomonas sp. Red32]MCM0081754.1 hypothetical protein [Geomonas sp. Red32]
MPITTFAPANSSYRPQSVTSPEEVEVYRTERPSRAFEEIGSIYVQTTDLPAAASKMKEEAAKQGGNAVIDIKITSDGVAGTVVRYKR